jgi:Tol biopolymer transport system component
MTKHETRDTTTRRIAYSAIVFAVAAAVPPASAGGEKTWNVRATLTWDGRQVDSHDAATPRGCLPDDRNGTQDVFLHDRWTGTNERVSLAWNGEEGERGGAGGSMSSDGRYVAFEGSSTNLVEDDENASIDVFVRDRSDARTLLVSVSSSGEQGDNHSQGGRISGNGRYVAFVSSATNLVPDDTNGFGDVFVRDLVAEKTVRVSVATDGTQGDGDSGYWGIDISPDGRYVVFATDAVLEPGDRNDIQDIYLHDRDADEDGVFDEPGAIRTERMSNLYGPDWNWGYVQSPVIGALARHVIYDGGERIGCDYNGESDVYGNNVGQRTNAIVSHAWRTTCTGNSWSRGPSITEDERYVAFYSAADNLIEQDGNFFSDVFLFDYEDGWNTRRISVGLDGAVPNGSSSSPVLTANGCFVLFQSRASNLIEGDTNDKSDLFVAPTGICPAEDFNGDATVDAADLEFFDLCLSGPADDRPQRCVPADFNRDRHVDLADFAVVQAAAARP